MKSHLIHNKLAGDNYQGLMWLGVQSEARDVNLRKYQALFLFVSLSLSFCWFSSLPLLPLSPPPHLPSHPCLPSN